MVKIHGDFTVETTPTKPIEGQKPGTSGLRKKTKVFMEGTYLANFVQSVFNTLQEENVPVQGGTLIVSGDGRFWNPEAIQIIIKMAFAAGVARVWCGTNGLLSTPATSAVIRFRGGKGYEPYNCENGGPAPEKLTNKMLEWTGKITELKSCSSSAEMGTVASSRKLPDFDLSKPELFELPGGRAVEIFDGVAGHGARFRWSGRPRGRAEDAGPRWMCQVVTPRGMTYDSMCGVQGPYALRVFEKELGAPAGTCKNATPLPDFGGPTSAWHGHADPNLTYAVELVKDMASQTQKARSSSPLQEGNKVETGKPIPSFGAAADGDADRNMICGSQFFISPSDSLAMIVANAHLIPQFKTGLKGCARSMPTSAALDLVAKKILGFAQKNIPCFEVPTGWKFFGNLMDSGTSYFPGKELDVANAHWKEYGRNYYARYDYEGVDKAKAEESDMFEYTDPVDGSISKKQGLRFIFEDNSRIIFRLSGTGVAGGAATRSLYIVRRRYHVIVTCM
eukprot:Skav202023  [mRNA]  locus=scaffold1138:136603:144860:+ [translate_table: standard]